MFEVSAKTDIYVIPRTAIKTISAQEYFEETNHTFQLVDHAFEAKTHNIY